ncbi:hypothetical protein [Neptuniibacter sp. QD37_11]|uniref:CYTH domain-containing protein n=1 Tax=Neptuniibacter sp. QD37_11 TaxID=3398209 RepID=UPI0039F62F06
MTEKNARILQLEQENERLKAHNNRLALRSESLMEVLAFYADPDSYFAVSFMADKPAGKFSEDMREVFDGLRTKQVPGKRASEALMSAYNTGDYVAIDTTTRRLFDDAAEERLYEMLSQFQMYVDIVARSSNGDADYINKNINQWLAQYVPHLFTPSEEVEDDTTEIEYKYLITNPEFIESVTEEKYPVKHITQGYLGENNGFVYRVRLSEENGRKTGYFTIKSTNAGIARREFEWMVPPEHVEFLLSTCESLLIKDRYMVRLGGEVWEVDKFADKGGLVTAELEVPDENYKFEVPSAFGPVDVSNEREMSNHNLSQLELMDVMALVNRLTGLYPS